MRDIGVIIALVLATAATGVLSWYAWPERKIYPVLGKMLVSLYIMLTFLWISFGWLWFSV